MEQKNDKRMNKKINKITLPRRILPLKNVDKTDHEKWDDLHKKNIANFPCPSRICIIGPAGVGKTNLCKNILLNARPLYDRVFLIHPDIEVSKEWDDIEPTDYQQKIPPLEYFSDVIDSDSKLKNVIVIDDIEFTAKNKDELQNLGLLMRYLSTHRNMTVIFSHQSWFDIPPIVKKMSNVYIIYKPKARTELALIENRCGVDKGLFKHIFNTIAKGYRDNICYDNTENTPAPLRLNLFDILNVRTKNEDEDEDEDDLNSSAFVDKEEIEWQNSKSFKDYIKRFKEEEVKRFGEEC